MILSFWNRDAYEPVALHCLWIGAASAVVACVMGWAYAQHEGYGSGFTFDLAGSTVDRHRWLGIAVAMGASLLVPVAIASRRSGDINKRIIWLLGSIVILIGVSITGYQGGELTYGEGHYEKEFNRLFPATEPLSSDTKR